MQITNVSQLTGIEHTMELDVTQEQLDEFCSGHPRRKVQHIFPNLKSDEREFLMTGITSDEWNKMFPPDE